MTYMQFLLVFIVAPWLILLFLTARDRRRGRQVPPCLRNLPVWAAIALLCLVALVYTTPWDNYGVATEVWSYPPERLVGITFGWVPLEEYMFFVLETLLVGQWLFFLAGRLPCPPPLPAKGATRALLALIAATWVASVAVLVLGWRPGTYSAILLVWFLPPLMLQVAVGGPAIVRHWRLVLLALVPASLWLGSTDALAIGSGIWAISEEQTVGILFGPLPFEEGLFFTVTAMLIVGGLVAVQAEESLQRLPRWAARLLGR